MEFITANCEKIIIVLLILQNVIKGIRDAIDTTPATDDNAFEKFATISTKALGYLLGLRPKVK